MNDKPDSKDPSEDDQEKLIDGALQQAVEAREQADANSSTESVIHRQNADSALPEIRRDSFTGYTIIRELHRGGQGVVYQAFQKSTKRKVAIKVMKEGPFAGSADKARFDREVQILGQLSHPNIVTIHDTGLAAGTHYFVMDYISGQSLNEYMDGGDHSIEETLKLFGKICEAVNAAHLRGIIHRDLKPGNIRIDDNGEPHILDFGLAKVAAGDQQASMMTMTGQFIGSLPWASPEQAEAAPSKIDTRTDVYSLGVIFYQMLTGKFPYEVIGNMRDVLDRIMRAEPARPSTMRVAAGPRAGRINDEVETIVLKCLSKERDRRYQTAGELARDLRRYLNGEPIEAKRDSVGYILRKQLKRYRVAAVAVALFFAVVTAGFATSLAFWRQAVRERAHVEEVAKFAQEMLSGVDPEIARGLDGTLMRLVLDGASQRIDRELADQPEIEASLRAIIGETYHALGDYAEAQAHLEKSLDIRQAVLGERHRETLRVMSVLGAVYIDVDRPLEAEKLTHRASELSDRILGASDPDALRAAHFLGALHFHQKRFVQAEEVLARTLDRQRDVLGEDHSDTLQTMSDLAVTYKYLDRLDDAERLFNDVLNDQRRTLGEDHPDTLLSLGNLSQLLLKRGRYGEAEPLLIESIQIGERVLGEGHRTTLLAKSDLGRVYHLTQRCEQAAKLLREAVTTARKSLPRDSQYTTEFLRRQGVCLAKEGRYLEAETAFLEAYEVLSRRQGARRSERTAHTVIRSLRDLYGAWHAAEPGKGYDAKAVEWRAKLPPREQHPDTLETMNNLAKLYGDQGRMDDARPLVRAAQQAGRRRADRPGASANDKNELAWNLLTCEPADLRDPETALRLARDACAMTDNANPAFLDTLALAQHLTGDTPAAIETEKKALSLLPPDDPRRGEYEAALAKFEAALEQADATEEPGGG